MIVYGVKNKELAKETVFEKCPHCGTQNSVELHVFQKYAHLFWIPLFPMGKTGISQCDHCKQVLKLKEMPSSLILSYDNLKSQTKTPVWMYTGLVLFVLLIGVGMFNEGEKNKKNAQLILAPKNGDVYEIKTKENQYTLYKVDAVEGDSVFVVVNNYETNRSKGISELKRKGDTAYSIEQYLFMKKELKSMLEKGEIRDIDRQ